MTKANRRQISLYEEAKTGLSSFLWQTLWGFLGVMMMLLLTGGNPPGFIVALSFCVGIGFVAWSEKKRLAKLRASDKRLDLEDLENITALQNPGTAKELEIDSSLPNSKSQFPKDISPNKRAIMAIIIRKMELLLPKSKSEQELKNLLQRIENTETENLSQLAAIASLNLAKDFANVDLRSTDLSGDYLSEVYLLGANLRGANMSETYLSGANLSKADLIGANLTGAKLGGANLSEADLIGANLTGAKLGIANLRGAKLDVANLREAILIGANLREAKLGGADLREAKLGGANLIGADLREANLIRADLSEADLREAMVKNTRFGDNQGISKLVKSDLEKRGAIFEDSPGETAKVPTRV